MGETTHTGLPQERIAAVAELLFNFPADGKLPETEAATDAFVSGLVTEYTVKKPCRNCGTPLTDYSYCRITQAGRFFMQAMEQKP